MKTSEFDRRFDAGEDINFAIDWGEAQRAPRRKKHAPKDRRTWQKDIELGQRIVHMRRDILGFTRQQDFADSLGVTRGSVGNWEVGKPPNRKHLQRIAEMFDISFEWLSTGNGVPRIKPGIDAQLAEFSEEEYEALHEDIQALIDNRRKRLASKS
jgi:transcriptional regulator with XRE-family HTH domain